MVESRPHSSHYLTEALQILPHILELDSLLLFQKLQKRMKERSNAHGSLHEGMQHFFRFKPVMCTYCFDALMKDRFMDEVEFPKFPDEFDVAQHLALCNTTLLLLFGGERIVMFVKDYGAGEAIELTTRNNLCIFSKQP